MIVQKFAIFVCFALRVTRASHFRGGTVSWKYIKPVLNKHQIEVKFRLGWRRSSDRNFNCDHATTQSNATGHNEGAWMLREKSGTKSRLADTSIKCSAFNTVENWTYGSNHFLAEVPDEVFDITFTGRAWINNLRFGGGSGWSVALLDVNLGVRSDTGKPNNPPVTLSPPIIVLQRDCSTTIRIVSTDDDFDKVTCRYGSSPPECSGICGKYSNFVLNETECTLSYNGKGTKGLVPVALMLEDHPRKTITLGGISFSPADHLSKIPLQFLVKITSTNVDCANKTDFCSPTIPEGAIISLSNYDATFNTTFCAHPSAAERRISQFRILGPEGVISSFVEQKSDHRYTTNILWTPSEDQAGTHDMCIIAMDDHGTDSDQRCFKIRVPENPCKIENGGCSDICTSVDTKPVCSCYRQCWMAHIDNKTCVPDSKMECDIKTIRISMKKCAAVNPIISGNSMAHFSQKQCHFSEKLLERVFRFYPSQCGTKTKVDGDIVSYEVVKWFWIRERYELGKIVRGGRWQQVRMTCIVPQEVSP